ncbi:hypothetical protein BWQ96_05970 [Gracilariopsis chorda]|uniref:Uncharacterized protein n=1 Tax=Gracilariopsis chorda TaxID=448386 RepID=A0A2V3IQA0_9FLOR|nr:hypothetical protein BWQ96_05970 [Gracilariopsis chorda]|eukprot:PXF44266.1 hypothetical protein BWQ96_05970 [Gracilariopsis chorda]
MVDVEKGHTSDASTTGLPPKEMVIVRTRNYVYVNQVRFASSCDDDVAVLVYNLLHRYGLLGDEHAESKPDELARLHQEQKEIEMMEYFRLNFHRSY